MQPKSERDFLKKIHTHIACINDIGKELFEDSRWVLNPTTITNFKLVPPELGFIRTVSWLFVLYNESDRKLTIDYLIGKFDAYDIDKNKNHSKHFRNVSNLRTYLQHDLIISSKHNRHIQDHCIQWYEQVCGNREPTTDEEWKKCLFEILSESNNIFENLSQCIYKIKEDEDADVIIEEWNFKIKRHHPPYEFDKIIQIVAADIGRDNLDFEKFRKRYYEKWINELKSLKTDYDFNKEARRLVEYTILSEDKYTPIDGKDIISHFNLSPGPQIGELITLSYELYRNNPCQKDDLLLLLEQKAKEKGIL